MTREEAKQAIAQHCGTTIGSSYARNPYCQFAKCPFWLNLLGKQIGFYFYSNKVVCDDELSVMGPWLQYQLKDAGFSPELYAIKTKRENATIEGHIADFYLDIDWEHMSDADYSQLKDLYNKLKDFQKTKWPASKDALNTEIRKYNEKHLDEVRTYISNFNREFCVSADIPTSCPISNIQEDQLSTVDKNQLAEWETEAKEILLANFQLVLTGAPGTGKTHAARRIAIAVAGDETRIRHVQFHPGYDYADFIIGIKPKLHTDNNENGTVVFDWECGTFKQFADRATKDLDHNYVLLIDEINRADLSRVFGELFSLLEDAYRYPENPIGVTLPNGQRFHIPKNLYIIGTMNDIDRSVESMDFALRRRFAWYEVDAVYSETIIDEKVPDSEIAKRLKNAMRALNFEIEGKEVNGRTPTLNLRLGKAYQLGGAIFAQFEKCSGNFDKLWQLFVKTTLNEYLRGRTNREELLKELYCRFNQAIQSTTTSAPTEHPE